VIYGLLLSVGSPVRSQDWVPDPTDVPAYVPDQLHILVAGIAMLVAIMIAAGIILAQLK
jgi:hypothetical protein